MVARLGIGATTASAVLFSILLASNLLVYTASQDRARHYLQSDAEDSLEDNAEALMGAAGVNVLLEAESFFATNVLGCPGAAAAAGRATGALSDTQRSDGLTVNVAATVPGVGAGGDPLPMLAPFDGSVPGDVDISLRITASGGDGAAGVSFEWSGVNAVHLPVRLQDLARDCEAAYGAISEAVRSTPAPNCTYLAVAPMIRGAGAGPASAAAADGFSFSLDFAVERGSGCTVSLQVGVQQEGVQGPGGPFTVRLQEGGSATFGQPPSAPQG